MCCVVGDCAALGSGWRMCVLFFSEAVPYREQVFVRQRGTDLQDFGLGAKESRAQSLAPRLIIFEQETHVGRFAHRQKHQAGSGGTTHWNTHFAMPMSRGIVHLSCLSFSAPLPYSSGSYSRDSGGVFLAHQANTT